MRGGMWNPRSKERKHCLRTLSRSWILSVDGLAGNSDTHTGARAQHIWPAASDRSGDGVEAHRLRDVGQSPCTRSKPDCSREQYHRSRKEAPNLPAEPDDLRTGVTSLVSSIGSCMSVHMFRQEARTEPAPLPHSLKESPHMQ